MFLSLLDSHPYLPENLERVRYKRDRDFYYQFFEMAANSGRGNSVTPVREKGRRRSFSCSTAVDGATHTAFRRRSEKTLESFPSRYKRVRKYYFPECVICRYDLNVYVNL